MLCCVNWTPVVQLLLIMMNVRDVSFCVQLQIVSFSCVAITTILSDHFYAAAAATAAAATAKLQLIQGV